MTIRSLIIIFILTPFAMFGQTEKDSLSNDIYAIIKTVIKKEKINKNYGLVLTPEKKCNIHQEDTAYLQTLLIKPKPVDSLNNARSSYVTVAKNFTYPDKNILTQADIDYILKTKEKFTYFKWDNSQFGFDLKNKKKYYTFSVPYFNSTHDKAIVMYDFHTFLSPIISILQNPYLPAMTDLKPKIFIGSSSSGYNVAEEVKIYLSAIADVYLWKDAGVWELNRSTFDNLLRMSNYFDFGVFVATSDDLTMTNDKLVIEPRDNVILEMALFLGAIGKDKSFLLVEEGIKLPSDFNGIYMPRFKHKEPGSIKAACDEFITKIEEHYQLGHLSLYPTTALAIGYYKNFLSGLVESVQNALPIEFDGISYNNFEIKVVMPTDLKGMIRQKADLFYKRHGFVENALKTQFRRHPAWFRLDPKTAPLALMYDMPSTLTGIDDAIEMILQKGFQGRTKMQEIIEQRELNNFRRVLQIMIDKNPYAQASVAIIDEF